MEIIFAVKECFFILLKFPHGLQHDTRFYGSVCIRMIAKYYGKSYSLQYLREHCFLTREGVSLLGISDAAERIGLKTVGAKITLEQLSKAKLPYILHWNRNHFVMCHRICGKGKKRLP